VKPAKLPKQKNVFLLFSVAAALSLYALTDIESLLTTPSIVGRASAIDSDTLDIHGQRIRLYGIDAPEGTQRCQNANGQDYDCGQQATKALSNKIGQQNVSCNQRDIDQYGRIVAICWAGDENLNRWLVSEGLAVAYKRYSVKYVLAEITARFAGRGLWAGDFMEPEMWRRENRKRR
jgi:endonuclease YncB( thermonuclease family)